MTKLKKLETSGNINTENAIGTVGTVYLGIPAERKGSGQIQIIVQGRLKTLHAQTDGKAIPTGQKVLVYAKEKKMLLVEPFLSD